jgi:hypothetical protein
MSNALHRFAVTAMAVWFAERILLHYADYPALRKLALEIDAPQPLPLARFAPQGVSIAS